MMFVCRLTGAFTHRSDLELKPPPPPPVPFHLFIPIFKIFFFIVQTVSEAELKEILKSTAVRRRQGVAWQHIMCSLNVISYRLWLPIINMGTA